MRQRAAWTFGNVWGLLLAAWMTAVIPAHGAAQDVNGKRATQPEARPAARPRTPNDTLKSPEVVADHKVTFRIYAPKASEVTASRRLGDGLAAS